VRDNVTISYRGASYEIGRGPHFYGIWVVGAPQPQPVEWWPETPEGWSSAWARFTGIEAPGTIAAVRPAATGTTRAWPPPGPQGFPPGGPAGQPAMTPAMGPTPVGHPAALAAQPGAYPAQPGGYPNEPGPYPAAQGSYAAQPAAGARAGLPAMVAAGLIAIGVVLGIASLFPHYSFGASLASEAPNLWPHVIYLAAWAGGALLIGLGGARLRMGALLAAGVSIVTFGLFVADAGQAISGGSGAWGTGLVLGLIGWLVCAIGSGLAVRLWQGSGAGRPQAFAARHIVTVVAALAALGTAITFAPSWDGYTLTIPNLGSSYTTAGNAFSNPGWVITGDVLAMIAVVLAVVVAVLWRPIREGAWLLAGAIIVMFAQAISALIQVGEPTSPLQFGVTPARAARLGLTITNSLTPAFWLFCAFVLVLMVGCGWLLLSPRAAALDTPGQRGHAPGGPAGTMSYSWPHPFTGGAQQTTQAGPQVPESARPESARPGTAQPGTAQPGGTEDTQPHATESTQPGAPQNTGLGIFDATPEDTATTDPDILDSHNDAPKS
jgi:hypothetical protein